MCANLQTLRHCFFNRFKWEKSDPSKPLCCFFGAGPHISNHGSKSKAAINTLIADAETSGQKNTIYTKGKV